jgi:hypothetical protein
MELNVINSSGHNVYIRRERTNIKFFMVDGIKVISDAQINAHTILSDIFHCDEIEVRHNQRWDASLILKMTNKEARNLLKRLGFEEELEELKWVRP